VAWSSADRLTRRWPFNFANPKITDEFARIAPGRNKSAAAFVLVMRLWQLPPFKLEPDVAETKSRGSIWSVSWISVI
jgi:hypothetical protein